MILYSPADMQFNLTLEGSDHMFSLNNAYKLVGKWFQNHLNQKK